MKCVCQRHIFLWISLLFFEVVSKCTFWPSPAYAISEEAPENTTILNFTKEADDTVSFSVQKPNQIAAVQALQASLGNVEENTTVYLKTTKTLDLEVFWQNYQADITSTIVTIVCNGVQRNWTVIDVTIVVTPVNKFPPLFLQGPYNISLLESTPLMTTVFVLQDKVFDNDVGEQPNFLFSMNPYTISDVYRWGYCAIPTSNKGDIVVARVLDYDNSAIRHVMTLNLSVFDSGGLRGFTTLEVKILDVDDQPPYFDFPNCARPCPVPKFMAITELDYKGPLQIIPVPLQGLDNDTLGTKLQFFLDSGNDHGMFSTDVNTGVVTQIRSVNEARSFDSEFRLVIKVRKNIAIDLQSLAILTVKVRERLMSTDIDFPPPTPTPTPTSKSTEKQGTSSGLVILTAVLGTLFACVIAVSSDCCCHYILENKELEGCEKEFVRLLEKQCRKRRSRSSTGIGRSVFDRCTALNGTEYNITEHHQCLENIFKMCVFYFVTICKAFSLDTIGI